MKLTLRLQLQPTPDQAPILLSTMERFNAAATFAAKVGFTAGQFNQPGIHKLAYREIRDRFGLTAQMAVRAIGKAVEAFRRDKTVCPAFKPRGAITYDQRILRFQGIDRVNLWTLTGRMVLPLTYGDYQGERFDRLKGQVDLVYRGGKFFLYATADIPEAPEITVKEFLGIDLGIVRLATDSDGNAYSGEAVERVRQRLHEARRSYQKTGTKSARRRLKQLARREGNYRRNENHRISKELIQRAKDTGRGVGLEDLKHIRERTTVRRKDRSKHSGWSFAQLQDFVTYKGKLAGVPVVFVDARGTSRTCSVCGHNEKGNRKSQAKFACQHCGFSENADRNAARVIGHRATFRWLDLAATVDPGLRTRSRLAASPRL